MCLQATHRREFYVPAGNASPQSIAAAPQKQQVSVEN
jgi:hypothetical protein